MSIDKPFDRQLRRLRRDRAARAPEERRYLHRLAADELIERLSWVKREFRQVLNIGDPYIAGPLRSQGFDVLSTDAGRLFARANGGMQCEEDGLPYQDGRFDLVTSVGVLDTVNDLPGALALIRRSLRPDGLFLAAFAGAGSVPRLRSAMLAAEEAEGLPASPRIHPQIDVRAAGDLLVRAGYALPVVDSETLTIRFSSFGALISDLRSMAATNMLVERSRQPLGRIALAAAIARFAQDAEPDGKVPERFDILYLSGWAPSPDQPKPARRGSASHSLADALAKAAPPKGAPRASG
jgi:SAM-dependent methyltransferase